MDRISHSPSAIDDPSIESSQRTRARDSLFLIARLTLPDEREAREVRVRNLSEGGLMVELDRDVAENSAVTLTMRGIGEMTGRVAWSAEGRIGVALDRPINPRLARKPVGQGPGTPHYAKPQLR